MLTSLILALTLTNQVRPHHRPPTRQELVWRQIEQVRRQDEARQAMIERMMDHQRKQALVRPMLEGLREYPTSRAMLGAALYQAILLDTGSYPLLPVSPRRAGRRRGVR
jgi:hypothetical protein